jgi:hypothetical protein
MYEYIILICYITTDCDYIRIILLLTASLKNSESTRTKIKSDLKLTQSMHVAHSSEQETSQRNLASNSRNRMENPAQHKLGHYRLF